VKEDWGRALDMEELLKSFCLRKGLILNGARVLPLKKG
jgi:hypothetical protein